MYDTAEQVRHELDMHLRSGDHVPRFRFEQLADKVDRLEQLVDALEAKVRDLEATIDRQAQS
jgi:ubiquinone biosynthesis protein UbiJ